MLFRSAARAAALAAAVRAANARVELAVEPDPRAALREARAGLEAPDLLCASGSVYLAGIAREVLGRPGPGA